MNNIGINGGQPQKPSRFAPIYTGRFFSGIWTNRSPLRDAVTNRMAEKFYGATGDAIIDGKNVEITNRLTLARRPGNPQLDALHTYTGVGNIDQFRVFGPNTERIYVMIDETTALYSLYNGTKNLVWNKTTGAGQSFMQSVGNSLYFGNGEDNKKWLQSVNEWASGATWNGANTPFLTTFLIDGNGNIQQLTSCVIPISSTQIASNVLTVTSSETLTGVLTTDLEITFPSGMAASYLSGQTVTVTGVSGNTFTAAFTHANDGPTAETSKYATVKVGGTPKSTTVEPTWSTTPLTPGMADPTLALTYDGTALWTNRGSQTQNWGIAAPTTQPTPTIGSSRVAWQADTWYSNPGVIIDSNGNLQRVTTAGLSGATAPTWATVVGNTTTDGTAVWTMIQTAASMVWAAHTTYNAGHFLIGNARGEDCLFRLAERADSGSALFVGAVDAWIWNPFQNNMGFGRTYPLNTATAQFHGTGNSVLFNTASGSILEALFATTTGQFLWSVLDGSGAVTSQPPMSSYAVDYFDMVVAFALDIPAAGNYTLNINNADGMFFGIDGNAELVSGPQVNPIGQTVTAVNGYPVLGADNQRDSGSPHQDSFVVYFPAAGTYNVEIDYFQVNRAKQLAFFVNGNTPVTAPITSGASTPVWPVWSTNYAPNYASIKEASGQYKWDNLGPVTDYVWTANVNYTLPNSSIIDPKGTTQGPFRTGITGTTAPTFATGLNQLTTDNPNLIWINQGNTTAPPPGTTSTYNGGWKYGIALVNSLDNTVSNCGPLSNATGDFIGVDGVGFTAGNGLPPASQIDPQADYVAIFRTTDGMATPFLLPGTGNSIYTVPLAEYLANGYTDRYNDEELNNLISGAIAGENTPPPAGAVNLTYHLSRIFFSVGNVVYWTAGPQTPVGNGVNGVPPLNFDEFPSLVKKIVPTPIGALVFTVSDVYVIPGQGTTNSPIQRGQPFLKGIGLLSYNALDINGSLIGLYTTDKQFVLLDPTSGVSYAGFPIGDRLRKNDGNPGTSWNANNVYVSFHVDGEDAAWYVADGQYGWYRLMPTPAPETGYTWSPFAEIVGGVKAVRSIEISPGVHKLLLGPTGTGHILKRDLDTFSDNGVAYPAYAVLGSIVLAQPGQLAEVNFVATDCVNIGTPLSLGILIDEALPYYTGGFETLKDYVNEPPNMPKSKSILGQRFYMSDMKDQAAVCRHLQLRINWNTEAVQNELLTMTIYGAYLQEN